MIFPSDTSMVVDGCYCKHHSVICQLSAASICLGFCTFGVTRVDVHLSEETERIKQGK